MAPKFTTLTSKQKKVYSAIEAYIKTNGIPPTVREIGEMVGEKTPGAVQGILNRLEQKGAIKRQVGMARSIQLVMDDFLYQTPVYVPLIKKISRRNIDNLLDIYNIHKYVPVSPDILPKEGEFFLINYQGIEFPENGDGNNEIRLVVSITKDLNDGDMALFMYENYLLLRKFCSTGDSNSLKFAGSSVLVRKEVFNADEVIIVGKALGKYVMYE